VGFRRLGLFGLVEMAVFIGLVFVAYVYVWRSGGLDWASGSSAGWNAAVEEPRTADPEVEVPEAVRAG
jgi:hypothetical protein